MGDEDQTTKPRQFRVADGLWEAYDAVCKRMGRTRAEDLNDHIRSTIKGHGTPQELERLAAAETELEKRRARQISGLRSQRSKQPPTAD